MALCQGVVAGVPWAVVAVEVEVQAQEVAGAVGADVSLAGELLPTQA